MKLDIFAASPDSSFFPGEVGMEANKNTVFGGDRMIGFAADELPPNKHTHSQASYKATKFEGRLRDHELLSASAYICYHILIKSERTIKRG